MSHRTLCKFPIAALLLLAGALPVGASKITVNQGDLLLSFYQLNTNNPPGVEPNTYSYNLGPASTWRENTSPTSGTIENINQDLVEAFGADWAENNRLLCSVVSVGLGGGAATVNGDTQRTTYYSQGLISIGSRPSLPEFTLSASRRGTLSTQLSTYQTVFPTLPNDTPGASSKGAIISSSTNNNYSAFVPPTQTTFFGLSINPHANFAPGNLGSANGYAVEAAVDVFRTLHTLTGTDSLPADTTVGLATGASVVGTGQYVGTFTIDSAGNIRMDATVAPVATAVGYAAWADAKGLTGADRGFDADPDFDTMTNGVEFVVGGNPKLSTDSDLQPTFIGNTFVFHRTDASAYLAPGAEYDTDLVGPWTLAVNGIGGVLITEESDYYGAGVDRVSVTLPSTSPVTFVRLKVVLPSGG